MVGSSLEALKVLSPKTKVFFAAGAASEEAPLFSPEEAGVLVLLPQPARMPTERQRTRRIARIFFMFVCFLSSFYL
jgi:hypothetical protein